MDLRMNYKLSHTLDSTTCRYRSSKGLLLKSPDCPLAWVKHNTHNGTLLVMLKADYDNDRKCKNVW